MQYCMTKSVVSCTFQNTQISNIAFPCVKTRVEMGFKPKNNIDSLIPRNIPKKNLDNLGKSYSSEKCDACDQFNLNIFKFAIK